MNESEARAYIGSMENGRMNPTLSVIERISKASNVSVGELMK